MWRSIRESAAGLFLDPEKQEAVLALGSGLLIWKCASHTEDGRGGVCESSSVWEGERSKS